MQPRRSPLTKLAPAAAPAALFLPDAVLAAGRAAAGAIPAEPMAASNLLQLLFGLFVVLVAIGATAFLLRRFGRFPSAAAGALRVVGGLSLGARERAVLVQVGDRQILLGVAPGRVETLHVLERPVVTAPGAAGSEMQRDLPGGFAERLASLMKGGRS